LRADCATSGEPAGQAERLRRDLRDRPVDVVDDDVVDRADSNTWSRCVAAPRYQLGLPVSHALIRSCSTASGARSRTTVISAPGTASARRPERYRPNGFADRVPVLTTTLFVSR